MEYSSWATRRKDSSGRVLELALGAIFIAGGRMAPATLAAAGLPVQVDHSTEGSRSAELRLGKQQRTRSNEITVTLEFDAAQEQPPNRIRATIEFAEGPWRFVKAQEPGPSSLKISVKKRSEERRMPEGVRRRITVLGVEVSAGNGTIPAGSVGELVFSVRGPDSVERIPLVLREWESVHATEHAPPPMLAPPPGEPGLNPSAGCFVFSH